MKNRIVVRSVTALVVFGVALATRNTDVIYVAVSVLFFVICIAYAEGCERL